MAVHLLVNDEGTEVLGLVSDNGGDKEPTLFDEPLLMSDPDVALIVAGNAFAAARMRVEELNAKDFERLPPMPKSHPPTCACGAELTMFDIANRITGACLYCATLYRGHVHPPHTEKHYY